MYLKVGDSDVRGIVQAHVASADDALIPGLLGSPSPTSCVNSVDPCAIQSFAHISDCGNSAGLSPRDSWHGKGGAQDTRQHDASSSVLHAGTGNADASPGKEVCTRACCMEESVLGSGNSCGDSTESTADWSTVGTSSVTSTCSLQAVSRQTPRSAKQSQFMTGAARVTSRRPRSGPTERILPMIEKSRVNPQSNGHDSRALPQSPSPKQVFVPRAPSEPAPLRRPRQRGGSALQSPLTARTLRSKAVDATASVPLPPLRAASVSSQRSLQESQGTPRRDRSSKLRWCGSQSASPTV